MTDKELIALLAEGRYEAVFNTLVKEYSERLYWHQRHFTASHEDADDLLQEVFIKLWQVLPTFRGESSFFTWMYRIATNEALSWLRKKKVRAALDFQSLENILCAKIEDDPYFDGDEVDRALQKAIAALPGKQKQVFLLRYYDEMPYEQIAEIVDSSVDSAKVLYHTAYKRIKEMLQKQF